MMMMIAYKIMVQVKFNANTYKHYVKLELSNNTQTCYG